MTTAELALKVDELKKVVSDFILEQKHYNVRVDKLEGSIKGNGKEGLETQFLKLDGRVAALEKNDARRQKLVDTLTAGLALTLILEILRLVFGA